MREEIRRKIEENRTKNANRKRMVFANPYEILQAKFKAVAELEIAKEKTEERKFASLAQKERRKREKQAKLLLDAAVRISKGEIHIPGEMKDRENDALNDTVVRPKLPYRLQMVRLAQGKIIKVV
jgi:hypothetical protein